MKNQKFYVFLEFNAMWKTELFFHMEFIHIRSRSIQISIFNETVKVQSIVNLIYW